MSLKVRLTVTMVGMVVITVLILSGMQLNSLVSVWLVHNNERSRMAAEFVKRWVSHRVNEMPPPPTGTPARETQRLWQERIAGDEELPRLLTATLVETQSLVEISVAGAQGRILASSNQERVGDHLASKLTLDKLIELNPFNRLLGILRGTVDYETRGVLGILGAGREPDPVFIIQVLVGSSLLRAAVMPEILWTTGISMVFVVVAGLLAFLVARLSLRPIERISATIDSIARGEMTLVPQDRSSVSEFQAVELKLRLLGEQFRGAKEGETQLRSSMERRLAAINRLTGGVAHEIKNPLNSIAIRLELLRDHLRETPQAEEEINIIAQEITRLDRVVRTFLDFTRPVELETSNLDLEALVKEVLTLIEPEAAQINVAIDLNRPPAPVHVRGDSDLLKQALLNVCRNALDFMPAGGNLRVGLKRAANEAVISIADTGPGIPPGQRDKIFQLYYSTKEKGSGIGLAMTFRAIQLHGGSIEVESEPGAGALFRLKLPVTA
jgi:signal transduction histidine kinase